MRDKPTPRHDWTERWTTLALGIVYWLMRERDDRLAIDSKRSSG